MKSALVDGFRDPARARKLIKHIRAACTREWTVMDVCGGQAHAIENNSLKELLAGCVRFIHGPGCPVCVTPAATIDHAITLARRPGVILASFGDMIRVPGSAGESLKAAAEKDEKIDVWVITSPLEPLTIAIEHPEKEVILFAIGFETTTAPIAASVLQAEKLGITNLSLLTAHVMVPPALRAVMAQPEIGVQGFLAAGHVCGIMGYHEYHEIAREFGVPIAVTGFDVCDILLGVLACVRQLERGQAFVENTYSRIVSEAGNTVAQAMIRRVYEVCDRTWRGIGTIPKSGLRLRPEYQNFDAEVRFGHVDTNDNVPTVCGDVIFGRVDPPGCPHFGTSCTPRSPKGSPMISSEGACSACWKNRGRNKPVTIPGCTMCVG